MASERPEREEPNSWPVAEPEYGPVTPSGSGQVLRDAGVRPEPVPVAPEMLPPSPEEPGQPAEPEAAQKRSWWHRLWAERKGGDR